MKLKLFKISALMLLAVSAAIIVFVIVEWTVFDRVHSPLLSLSGSAFALTSVGVSEIVRKRQNKRTEEQAINLINAATKQVVTGKKESASA